MDNTIQSSNILQYPTLAPLSRKLGAAASSLKMIYDRTLEIPVPVSVWSEGWSCFFRLKMKYAELIEA